MNPLLLGLLAAGAAYVLLRKPSCPEQPPPNPFFSADGGINWDKLAAALGENRGRGYEQTQEYIAYAMVAASILKSVPGLGWYGAAVAVAAKVADKISGWISKDYNGEEYRNRAKEYSDELMKKGFIPATYYPDATFFGLANLNATRLWAVNLYGPYLKSLFASAGQSFRAWGGHPPVAAAAMPTISVTHEGNAPTGSYNAMDSYAVRLENQKKDFAHNATALPSMAAAIAVSVGKCDQIDEVVRAALYANNNFPLFFPDKAFRNIEIDPKSAGGLAGINKTSSGTLSDGASTNTSSWGGSLSDGASSDTSAWGASLSGDGADTSGKAWFSGEPQKLFLKSFLDVDFVRSKLPDDTLLEQERGFNVGVFAYAAGIWAAIDKASELAGLPRPRLMTKEVLASEWFDIPTYASEEERIADFEEKVLAPHRKASTVSSMKTPAGATSSFDLVAQAQSAQEQAAKRAENLKSFAGTVGTPAKFM